jgi:Zn-dependent M28 family amino/carboxypeptidase
MKTVLPAFVAALACALATASEPHHAINSAAFVDNIRVLSSDDFEGRGPGTPGEQKTTDFIVKQWKALGVKGGKADGSFLQAVPTVGIRSRPTFSYSIGGKTVALNFPDDYVAYSARAQPSLDIEKSELVFVGYGVQAPEYGWDDYKGVDVRGKTIVMLINDPAIPDPSEPGKLDASMFKGEAMTYYGRWTYKYEIAAKLGAAAAIIVHETKPAAYPYDVVRAGATREQLALALDGPDPSVPPVPGWIHLDKARAMMAAAGLDFDKLKQAALSRDFRPVSLGGSATFHIKSDIRKLTTHNVVGVIEGSDPVLKHEYVLYSAHWDHLGFDPSLPGPKTKQVFHGALDNASGTSSLIEFARAFKSMPVAPKRSIILLATTLEEHGLIGARYYANNPVFPVAKTVLGINIDNMNGWGKTAVIENVTSGHSTADALLAKHALAAGRTAVPDSVPNLGSFYRADHVELAKVGVPVLYTKSRSQYVNQPPDYAKKKLDAYYATDYHNVHDILRPEFDFSGAIDDMRLLLAVGLEAAQSDNKPRWYANSEFKAVRDASLKPKP